MALMNSVFVLLLLSAFSTLTLAQTSIQRCGTMQHLEYLKQQDPALESRMAMEESRLQQNIATERIGAVGTTSAPIVVRVVVHVLWSNATQNISDTRILSQIDVLNEDFNRYNTDTVNTPSVFAPVAANTGIHFCLATTDPNGNPTTGINRVQTTTTSFNTSNNVKYTSQGGADAWDPNTYFNIWVCNLGNGILGYAQLPGGALATSGVVIHYSVFGRNGTMAPYNQGRTATHEIAHAFNLRHLWGDAACGNDFVSDTPVQQGPNYNCPVFPQVTCTNGPNGDMFMNFMDHTDDACMNLFTEGQGTRMQAAIYTSYPGIISNLNCVPNWQLVSGNIYYDINQNGQKDVGENGMMNQNVLLSPTNTILNSDNAGNYKISLDSGTYTIQMPPNPLWNITQGNAGYTFTVDSSTMCCNDFGLSPVSVFDNVSINYTASQYRCGFDVSAWITLINDGTSIVSGVIRYVPDDSMIFVASTPAPDNNSGDTLYFTYSNLFPGQEFVVNLVYEMPMTTGLVLCSNTLASIFDGTIYQPFTENLYCDTITCSYDPNDKNVIPPGVQAQNYILKTDTLLYTIRFQNEGNDTAFTVIIRDTLSSLLDRNTIVLAGSSHPVSYNVNSANEAEFRFENILLPHKSINETGSQGFVSFRILPLQGLPDGTVINNEAGIYFDFNPPVITNNTFVTLVTTIPVGINEVSQTNHIQISPQPFTTFCEVMITTTNSEISAYSVFDIAGRKITEGFTTVGARKLIRLDTAHWNKGFYFIRVNNLSGTALQTARLLKQ